MHLSSLHFLLGALFVSLFGDDTTTDISLMLARVFCPQSKIPTLPGLILYIINHRILLPAKSWQYHRVLRI